MGMRLVVGATIVWMMLPVSNAVAQDRDSDERPITLVGCVMRESQFRDMYGPGQSGPRGAGLGGRNEYMLVDAREISTGGTNPGVTPVANGATCPPEATTFPTAYELTGSREGEIGQFLGRRVEVTGIQKEANARPVGTSGVLQPTGGFDPLGHELHLFEVEIESFREPSVALASAPPAAELPAAAPAPAEQPPVAAAEPPPAPEVSAPAPAPAPEPAPAPAPEPEPAQAAAPPAPQPESTVAAAPVEELPRTSSPLPLAGLLGLLSFAAAAGVRSLRRRS